MPVELKKAYPIRLSEAELTDYKKMAKDLGLPSVASFVRYTINNYKKTLIQQVAVK
jgi:hypothetical protein